MASQRRRWCAPSRHLLTCRLDEIKEKMNKAGISLENLYCGALMDSFDTDLKVICATTDGSAALTVTIQAACDTDLYAEKKGRLPKTKTERPSE